MLDRRDAIETRDKEPGCNPMIVIHRNVYITQPPTHSQARDGGAFTRQPPRRA
ncbi:MAG TPA: hypothetical protein VFM75_08665 [Modicisalibacter sp.]|nr:hypothetical protein [Modicisalibacter sp.]